MRSDKERILDILEAIERIEKYSVQGKEPFENDELIQNWAIHHLQIIGEAAARLTEEVKEANSEIPWFKIIGMRNILVHGYFGIDTEIVWAAIEKELPQLKDMILNLSKKL